MRVGVAAPGFGWARNGGVDVYLRELLRTLSAQAAEAHEITLLLRPDDDARPLPERLRVARLAQLSPVATWRRVLRLAGGRAGDVDALGLDVIHCPATRLIEPTPRTPVVLTFFDMQEEFLPGNFTWRARWARRLLHRHGVRRARLVLAPSRFTADCLRTRYGTPESKLRVVPPGVAPAYYQAPRADDAATLRARYDLVVGAYALYPAHPWPHKNHALLMRAWAHWSAQAADTPTLVCTGRLVGEPQRLTALAAEAGLRSDRLRDLGFVPEDDLPLLLRGARLLVFPSLFEGFGLPVAEALAAGCPVLCADIPPLRELSDGAARLVAPRSERAWSAALGALWNDADARATLAAVGRRRAEALRWERLLPALLAAYRDAVGLSSRAG